MDIDLLSKMVKELVLDNDSVCLPGLGTFVAEVVPSTFSDRGYTINPPYRRLYFRQHQEVDTRLADLYASSNNVDVATATKIISDFLVEMKSVLEQKKTIVFPGLGRLRATRENNFFFVPDETLDIYPEGFGLEPVSLKTHEESTEEVSQAVSGLESILKEGSVSTSQELDAPQMPKEPLPATSLRKKRNPWLISFLAIVVAIVLFLVAFIILAKVAPDFIDSILYTPEQLRIINS